MKWNKIEEGFSMNKLNVPHRCGFIGEANYICDVLVREIIKSETWGSKKTIIEAIQAIRFAEKDLVAEWEHLNNPGIDDCACEE